MRESEKMEKRKKTDSRKRTDNRKKMQDIRQDSKKSIQKNKADVVRGEKGRKEKKKNSRCQVSGKCGGCQFIDVPYEKQLEQKKKEIAKLLQNFCKLEKYTG